MKHFYRKAALLLLFCFTVLSYGKAQTTIDFNGLGHTDQSEAIGSSLNYSGYTFEFFSSSGTLHDFYYDVSDGYSGSEGLSLLNYTGNGEKVVITKSDGGNFKFDSFFRNDIYSGYKIEGFISGSSTGSVSYGTGSALLSLGSNFYNVDEVVISSTSSGFYGVIDHFTFSAAAAPNTAPTASSNTLSNNSQGIARSIATSAFGYSDGDGDALNHVRITSLPTKGTLFVDANGNDTFDSGEGIAVNSQVSKFNLDAGNLFYLNNDPSGDDSFAFDVNDGTDYSGTTYTMTLGTVAKPTVTLATSTTSISESGTSYTLTANLSHSFGANVTVDLAYSGTASYGAGFPDFDDYTQVASITVPAGNTSASATISLESDNYDEFDETIITDISNVTNGSEDGTQQVTTTIIDDDPEPTAIIYMNEFYPDPFDEGYGHIYIRGKLSDMSAKTVTINLSLSGTATSGLDYTTTASIVIEDELIDSVRVDFIDDAIGGEFSETIIADISSVTNGSEDDTQQLTITIDDNDNTPPIASSNTLSNNYQEIARSIATSDFGYSDGDSDALDHVRVTSLPTKGKLFVDANGNDTYESGEEIAANDQISKSNLDAGNLFYLNNDPSGDDSFVFDVNDGTDYSASTYTMTLGTVAYPTVTLGVDASSKSESLGSFTLTATLSHSFPEDVTVNLAYSGTATSSVDYFQVSNIVVASGNTSNTASLPIISDAYDEDDETIIADISSVDKGTKDGTQQITATITDDDPTPTVSLEVHPFADNNIDENNETAYLWARLSAVSGQEVTVNVTFSGTATNGTDYTIGSSSIHLYAGEMLDSLRITTIDDGLAESTETIIADISSITNANEDGTQQFTFNVLDDDDSTPPTVTISTTESDPTNANPIPLTFTFSEAVNGFTDADITTSNGSISNFAGSGDTYTADFTPSADGAITVDVNAAVATDDAGNDNTAATQLSLTYDNTAPSGYTVAFDQSELNPGNWTNASFTFAGAEAGASYNYSISSSGDGNTATITGNGTIATANEQISGLDLSSLTNGTLTLSVTLSDATGNTGSSTTATISKDKYSQSITFNALADKTYGDADFDLSATASSGLTVTYESSDNTIASISGNTVSILKAGSVTITAKQSGDADYNAATDVNQTLTINKAMLTVTAQDKSKTYGEANPSLSVTYSGFVNSDAEADLDTAPTASLPETSTSNVGIYPISVAGGVDNNYNFSYVAGTLTVNKATLTVTAEGKSKTYGEANPGLTVTYSGFVNRDYKAFLDTEPTASTTADATSDAGTYAITVAGGVDNNYDFSYVNGTLTINKATLTVTVDDQSKTYGEANPTLSFDYSGFVNSDSETDIDTAPSTSTAADATTDVGNYQISVAGGADNNYDFSYVNGTLTINKATLTVTADDQSKSYGEANPTLNITYSGFVNSDSEADLDTAPNASTTANATSDAGSYPISVSAGSDNNYDFSYVNGTMTIDKATLTVTADDQNKTYGNANPALTFSYAGFVNSDSEADLDTAPSASTSTDATSDAGTYAITVAGGADINYDFSYVDGTLTINKAALTVTANDQSKTYGDANPTLSFNYSGFVNSDSDADLDTAPSAATTADATSNVGTYPISVAGGTDNNYDFSYVNGTLTINKATLTVTADDHSKTYGEANPTLSITYSGFVNSDSEADLDTAPSASTTADATSSVGTYPISVTAGADNNYDFSYVNGTMTINKATLTVTADNQNKTYGETNPSLTFAYSGFAGSDDESVLNTAPSASTSADATSDAGTYTITVSGGADNNYDFSYVNGTMTIGKAMLTVTANDQSKTYGDANPTLTTTYSGFVGTDDESVLDTAPSTSTAADATTDAGNYQISVSAGADNNYDFSYVNGTLTINKATLTVTADDQSKSYGEANPTLTFTYSGFVNSDSEAELDTAPSASTTADATSAVGTYAITVVGGTDNNYDFSYVNGTLTINKATLTVTADDQSKTFGETNPTLTFTYSGFAGSDDESVLDTAPSASTSADATSDAGTYAITVAGGADNNYDFSYVNATLTINKATLTVTADDKQRTYSDVNPELTFTYSGFVNGDQSSVLDVAPTASTTATEGSPVGEYDITLSGGQDANYAFTYVNATLTITNNAPSFSSTAITVATEDQAYSYSIVAEDNDAGETLTITASTLPEWLSLTDNQDGTATLSGTPANEQVGIHAVNLQVSDEAGETDTQNFTITVSNTNDVATAITLSTNSVLENQPSGTLIGELDNNDPDSGENYTYSLVAGEGSEDNSFFSLSGAQLLTASRFDYEAKNTYSIRLQVNDQNGGVYDQAFTINIQSDNTAPSEIILSSTEVAENMPEETLVATLSTTDPDEDESFTYSLVAGDGDDDNEHFSIFDDELRTQKSFNYEEQNSYSIRILTTDKSGAQFSRSCTITITDVNDAPELITLSNDTTREHQAIGTLIGFFETQDQDPDNSHTFSLVEGEGSQDNNRFLIEGNELVNADTLDYEDQEFYSIRVQVQDNEGATYQKVFEISTYPNDKLELVIPSTFTPNGDGYNDSWIIDNISGYDPVIVRIVDRSNKTVFTSTGYEKPWDGTFRGQDLPSDTYKYIIRLPNHGNKVYTGSVFILRGSSDL